MVRVTPLNPSDEAAPVRSRLGMLRGQLSVPDDFDRMGQEEIADLFEGSASADAVVVGHPPSSVGWMSLNA